MTVKEMIEKAKEIEEGLRVFSPSAPTDKEDLRELADLLWDLNSTAALYHGSFEEGFEG